MTTTDGFNATLSDKSKMSTAALIQELEARFEFENLKDIYPVDFIKDSINDYKVIEKAEYIEIKETIKELYHRHVIKPTMNSKGGTQ